MSCKDLKIATLKEYLYSKRFRYVNQPQAPFEYQD